MTLPLERKLFTVQDYHKMRDADILTSEDRVELINGEIIPMSPIKSKHASVVDFFNKKCMLALHSEAIIRVQNPVEINDLSELEPDVAIVKKHPNHYRFQHPKAEDVLLLIEVSDSTLAKDQTVKLALYANANIPEYWIINIPEQQVEVYTKPKKGKYLQKNIYDNTQTIQARTINFSFAVNEIF